MGGENQELEQLGQCKTWPWRHHAGRVMTSREVMRQVNRHCFSVFRDEDPPLTLRPKQKVRIFCCQWQIGRITDADYINHIGASNIMSLDDIPKRPPEILVQ